jgi:hypothetical protein
MPFGSNRVTVVYFELAYSEILMQNIDIIKGKLISIRPCSTKPTNSKSPSQSHRKPHSFVIL